MSEEEVVAQNLGISVEEYRTQYLGLPPTTETTTTTTTTTPTAATTPTTNKEMTADEINWDDPASIAAFEASVKAATKSATPDATPEPKSDPQIQR